jgi:hypothetical protein
MTTRLPPSVAQAIRKARHVHLAVEDRYHDLVRTQWVRVSKAEARRIMRMRPDEAELPIIQISDEGDAYIAPGYQEGRE